MYDNEINNKKIDLLENLKKMLQELYKVSLFLQFAKRFIKITWNHLKSSEFLNYHQGNIFERF